MVVFQPVYLNRKEMKWEEVAENYIKRSFISRILNQVYQNDQVKEDEMGRECSTDEIEEESTKDFVGKARRK
jgi:hypothetical protein